MRALELMADAESSGEIVRMFCDDALLSSSDNFSTLILGASGDIGPRFRAEIMAPGAVEAEFALAEAADGGGTGQTGGKRGDANKASAASWNISLVGLLGAPDKR